VEKMAKEIMYNDKARRLLVRGIEKLYNVVKVTIGPKGNNVMLDTHFTPLVINDGYMIAKQIELSDKYENMGAMLTLEVARNTNDDVGDGTTSAIIIAANMMFGANQLLNRGYPSATLKRNLSEIKNLIISILREKSRKINDLSELEQVATISSKDERIGKMIREIYEQLQTNVAIVVEEGIEEELRYSIQKGIVIERGYMSKFMISDYINKKSVLKKANVVIVGEKYDMSRLLNISERPILLIFSNINADDLHTINKYIINCKKQVVAIRKDEFDEKLDDLRVLCDMELVDGHLMGCAQEIVVTRNRTTIINNHHNEEYIKQLTSELEGMDDYHKSLTRQRIASLSGGIGKITVGCNSEIELQEVKCRIEDAINACENAYLYGISLGEGVGYLEVIDELKKYQYCGCMKKTVEMVTNALAMPYRLILKNGNIDYRCEQCYDFSTMKFVPRADFKVYDPTRVLETVVSNTISVLSMFIVTNVVIADYNDISKSIDL
jgi:chaperonin GroEL